MRTLLALAFLFSASVFAAPGAQEPVHPNYRNYQDMVGLCTEIQGNKDAFYFKSGHCQTIFETLNNSDCVKQRIEQIRLRFLGDAKKMRAAHVRNTNSIDLGVSCTGTNDPENQTVEKIAEDPHRFNIFLMQLFSMIAIEESNWRVNEGGDTSQNHDVKCTTHCGLLGLNKEDMEKEKYSCGCSIPNKKDDQKQFDPTMDGHLNLRCGITMAIIEAADDKDNTSLLGSGKPKGPGQPKDNRSGMAKIFRSLESRDDRTDAIDTPLERIREKMHTYCNTEAFSNNNINRWRRTLDDSKGINDLNPSSPTTR